MSEKMTGVNQVTIGGEILSLSVFRQEMFREKVYTMKVKRNSEVRDVIPVIIPDRLINGSIDLTEGFIKVNGHYRSCNKLVGGKSRLILYVYAKEIEFTGEEPDTAEDNHIVLEGYICKSPVYRKTPLGRWITDIMLAVNGPCGRSDYIPCICWGREAKIASDLEIGSYIKITGRIQSREYIKKLTETESEKRIAYEVSVKKLEMI